MSILSKIVTLFRGAATEAGQSVIDANATRILDQEIRDAQNESLKSKEGLTKLIAQQKLAETRLSDKTAKQAEYEGYIAKLLAQKNETLAREVAEKLSALEADIATEQAGLSSLKAGIDKLHAAVKSADRNIASLQQQVDQVKANESVLKAQAAVAARYSGQNAKLRTALDSLERIKVRQTEASAQIDAANTLAAQDGDGDLDAKLASAGIVAGRQSVDDVLARLRKAEPAALTHDPAQQLAAPDSTPKSGS